MVDAQLYATTKKIEQLETWKYEVMTIYPILETLIFLGINFINNMGI